MTASLFLNQSGSFDFTQANQVMRFGYDLNLDVITQHREKPSERVFTQLGSHAIRVASMNCTQLPFGSRKANPARSSIDDLAQLVETFSADNVRGLSEQMSLKHDVDGDGRNDALYITENGTWQPCRK